MMVGNSFALLLTVASKAYLGSASCWSRSACYKCLYLQAVIVFVSLSRYLRHDSSQHGG